MGLTGPQPPSPGASPTPAHGLRVFFSAQPQSPFAPAWAPWMDSLGQISHNILARFYYICIFLVI